MKKHSNAGQIVLNLVFIILSLCYILPFVLLISISVSSENAITQYGYTLLPKEIGFDGYKAAFQNPTQLLQSYKVTIMFSLIATFLSLIVEALFAYPLSRPNYKIRKFSTKFIFITMIFSGGMVPSYIINTKYLHLGDTLWVYILPALVSAWNIIVMRTFFSGLPEGLVEAAKIDGARELMVFFRIILPLSTPVLASLGFMYLLGKWNDWNTALLYIKDPNLYSLQYLLQKIMNEAEFVNKLAKNGEATIGYEPPTETLRYAMAILAAGPMMVIFPFFQKYFAQGLTIGAVKG